MSIDLDIQMVIQTHKKMHNGTSYQGSENQNHEILSDTCQNDHDH